MAQKLTNPTDLGHCYIIPVWGGPLHNRCHPRSQMNPLGSRDHGLSLGLPLRWQRSRWSPPPSEQLAFSEAVSELSQSENSETQIRGRFSETKYRYHELSHVLGSRKRTPSSPSPILRIMRAIILLTNIIAYIYFIFCMAIPGFAKRWALASLEPFSSFFIL
jgi:hypothetical protein